MYAPSGDRLMSPQLDSGSALSGGQFSFSTNKRFQQTLLETTTNIQSNLQIFNLYYVVATGKAVDTLIVFIFKSLIVANGGKFYLPIHGIIN